MRSKQEIKGFAHLLLIIGVVLVGIVGIGYFAIKNGQMKVNNNNLSISSPTPTPQIDENENWKIFKSTTYSLKYPPDLQIVPPIELYSDDVLVTTDNGTNIMTIAAEDADAENAREYVDLTGLGMVEIVTINGVEVVSWLNDVPNVPFEAYTFVGNGKTYYINNNAAGNKKLSETFTQILSTFKFIETCSFDDRTCPEGLRCVLTDAFPGSKGVCSDEMPELEKSCLDNGGNWLQKYSECENISEGVCKNMLGAFEECASNLGCRHNDSGKPCLPTAGCTRLCSF